MKTDNELIAEFMGCRKVQGLENAWEIDWLPRPSLDRLFRELKFDTSWDWLMPVVDKIYKWGSVRPDYGGTIRPYKYLNDLSIMADLQQTYVAVVEFIKWYNENQKA